MVLNLPLRASMKPTVIMLMMPGSTASCPGSRPSSSCCQRWGGGEEGGVCLRYRAGIGEWGCRWGGGGGGWGSLVGVQGGPVLAQVLSLVRWGTGPCVDCQAH